mmetsp:Transcript_40012/g.46826  ORF Transcript_40012/g.46826 Transcript_40012/m.46826 type:complete len:307 (+) Transcript_40012:74-994(+)
MESPCYPCVRGKFLLTVGFIAMIMANSQENPGKQFKMTVRNELTKDVTLFWEEEIDQYRHEVGLVKSHGGEAIFDAFAGHVFSYVHKEERHFVEAPADAEEHFVVLNANEEDILVRCSTTAKGREEPERLIDFHVRPNWSPRGAARFLSLIRHKHYDGVAINRVVKNFLTQFGIPSNPETRLELGSLEFQDDPNVGIPFVPGMLSFAGNGKNSRTTEVFVVMPDCIHLSSFGKEPWETPFGFVGSFEESVVTDWYDGYGDMPPDGNGPDPQKIYPENGYEYLEKEFPKMDYINECIVIKDFLDEEL